MVFRINSQVSFLTSYMIGLLFISVFISTTLIILSVLLHCCVVFLTSPGLCQAHSYHMCFAIAILSTLPVSWEICIQDKKTIFRNGHGTDWFQIGKGICQGCILLPCLFNLYAEYSMWNARLDDSWAGIKIAGRNINNLKYADDITLMAES